MTITLIGGNGDGEIVTIPNDFKPIPGANLDIPLRDGSWYSATPEDMSRGIARLIV